MSTCGRLLKKEPKKEQFDLGTGDWFSIFGAIVPFRLTDLITSPQDLANELKNHVFEGKDYSEDECLRIAKEIMDWAGDSLLYLGTDVDGVWDEKGTYDAFNFKEYPVTKSRYYDPNSN